MKIMSKAYGISVFELAKLGKENIPKQLVSSEHLIYSSPATLAFNSPGANGFGVKRAGLSIPGSVMLLVSPGCCGRNTTLQARIDGYSDKFFYLLLDDTDIVTGRYLTKVPAAVSEVYEACRVKPSCVVICITCVDALLGTDMERVCRKATDETGVKTVPCYMYALTREQRLPPMAAVRKSVYSLLEKTDRYSDEVNILGFFAPLNDDCELYELMKSAGVSKLREISRCGSFEEYKEMSRANFNLVLNPESRYAAEDLTNRLGIPSIELTRTYRLDKIKKQYELLGKAIGAKLDDKAVFSQTHKTIADFAKKHGKLRFSVGETANADPFELSLALAEYGFEIAEIFGTVGEANFAYINKLSEILPDTPVYSNLSPTMMGYTENENRADVYVGRDAGFYHSELCGVYWNEERQPFGYRGLSELFAQLDRALSDKEKI